jgi:hypothetical protein
VNGLQLIAIHQTLDSALSIFQQFLRTQEFTNSLELAQLAVDHRGMAQSEWILACFSKTIGKIQLYTPALTPCFPPESYEKCF